MAVQQSGDCSKNHNNEALNSRNSTSEPDLVTADWNNLKSGFPPGTTVDELWHYRRKRPSANLWQHDNLTLEEGSFKQLKTEYKRRFRNYHDFGSCGDLDLKREDLSPVRATKPDGTLKVEGSREFQQEYTESFVEYPITRRDVLVKPASRSNSFELIDARVGNAEMKEISSEADRLLEEIKAQISTPRPRPPLIKRSTNLKIEGDFYSITEQAEQFIEYLLEKRPDLIRKPTTLKLEGDMDIKTEMREQFVPLQYQARPPLCKKLTNLHLEGEQHNTLTEKQEQFVSYAVQKRPPLTKKSTNLHVEGDMEMMPEYTREYVDFKSTERPKPALPVNNLKTDGFYDVTPDVSKPFQQQIHPQIPFLRGDSYDNLAAAGSRRKEHLKPEGDMMETMSESRLQFAGKSGSRSEKAKISNNLLLEGRIDMNPEYRNAYIDFNKDGLSASRGTSRRVVHQQQGSLKSEGKMDISPEYSRSYVNFPRERPLMRRPECSLSSEGELDHLTEQNEKYVPFANVPRTGSLKRDSELKLEGNFECQPEYRKAYVDYLIRERAERKPRPIDNLGTQRRAFEIEPVEKVTLVNVPTVHAPPPLPPPKPKPPPSAKPAASSTTSSVPSSPKSAGSKIRSPRNRSLSQIEASVFGPKLTVPPPSASRKSSSRSSSPLPPAGRTSPARRKSLKSRNASPTNANINNQTTSTATDSDASCPRSRKFGNPIKVENLAYRTTTPLPIPDMATRNKWMRDSSQESSTSAFVVLDKEVNNNYILNSNDNAKNRHQQRWMPAAPSWYGPSP